MREVLQENMSKPDNRRMMSESRFDGVIETMEFKKLTDQAAQVVQLKSRPRVSRSTRSYDVSYVDQKAPRSVS